METNAGNQAFPTPAGGATSANAGNASEPITAFVDESSPYDVSVEGVTNEAYQRLYAELRAIPTEELQAINLDVEQAVTTTLGALPEIRALRPRMAKELPTFDLVAFDKLEDYALVLHYTHAQYLAATRPVDGLEDIVEEAQELRETLFLDASTLARRGHINSAKLSELPGMNGFRNLATDLVMLEGILRANWSKIQGKCDVQLEDLDRATKLSRGLMRVVGLREQSPAQVASATEMRLRAFTLLSRTYDNTRSAVMYLRWKENDADKIAPSLYAGRSNGRRKIGTEVTPPGGTSPVPGATSGVSPAPTSGVAAATGTLPSASAAGPVTDHGPFLKES